MFGIRFFCVRRFWKKCSQTLTLTWRRQQYHIKHHASTYMHSYSLQGEVTIWSMIKLCPQDGLSEIMTFCYVQLMFQLMAHGCGVMNQTVHTLAEFCHRGLILPKGAVLTLVKQMEGEQTCSCHSTAYFSLLYGWFLLFPDHQACSDLPQIGFATGEPDICQIIFILPLGSTNDRQEGGCHL